MKNVDLATLTAIANMSDADKERVRAFIYGYECGLRTRGEVKNNEAR